MTFGLKVKLAHKNQTCVSFCVAQKYSRTFVWERQTNTYCVISTWKRSTNHEPLENESRLEVLVLPSSSFCRLGRVDLRRRGRICYSVSIYRLITAKYSCKEYLSRRQRIFFLQGSRDSPCLPGRIPDSLTKLYELYNDVQTFVMFIGYPRSSHSLVGAILDAHPEIIIPHEYHIIEHWNSFQEEAIKKSSLLKYLLFFNLHSLSTWQATFGNRAEKPVFIDDGIYSYNVPGSWQGTFNDKLRVSFTHPIIL